MDNTFRNLFWISSSGFKCIFYYFWGSVSLFFVVLTSLSRLLVCDSSSSSSYCSKSSFSRLRSLAFRLIMPCLFIRSIALKLSSISLNLSFKRSLMFRSSNFCFLTSCSKVCSDYSIAVTLSPNFTMWFRLSFIYSLWRSRASRKTEILSISALYFSSFESSSKSLSPVFKWKLVR